MTAFDTLWPTILDVGRHTSTGGYRRYAWSDADLTLAGVVLGCAARRGMDVEEDRNGNLWAWWMPPGWTGDPTDAFVTGSHLDSVPDGGAFDGPLGVVSAFAAIDVVRERGVVPQVPVAVVAFSDEEGARFGVACVGSQLSTGALSADKARALRDIHGVTLGEAMTKAGRRPEHLGVDPHLADRVGVYVELHVEQGRALDLRRPPDRHRFGHLAARALAVHVLRRGEPRGHHPAGRPARPDARVRILGARRRGRRPPPMTRSRRSARSSSHPTAPTRFPRR